MLDEGAIEVCFPPAEKLEGYNVHFDLNEINVVFNKMLLLAAMKKRNVAV